MNFFSRWYVMHEEQTHSCSLCDANTDERTRIYAGTRANICDVCLLRLLGAVAQHGVESPLFTSNENPSCDFCGSALPDLRRLFGFEGYCICLDCLFWAARNFLETENAGKPATLYATSIEYKATSGDAVPFDKACSNCGKSHQDVERLFVRSDIGLSLCNDCLFLALRAVVEKAVADRSIYLPSDLDCTTCGRSVLEFEHLVRLNGTFICFACIEKAISEFLERSAAEEKVAFVRTPLGDPATPFGGSCVRRGAEVDPRWTIDLWRNARWLLRPTAAERVAVLEVFARWKLKWFCFGC